MSKWLLPFNISTAALKFSHYFSFVDIYKYMREKTHRIFSSLPSKIFLLTRLNVPFRFRRNISCFHCHARFEIRASKAGYTHHMSDQVALNMTCDCLSRLPRLDFLVFHRVSSVTFTPTIRFITLLISISVADLRPFY